MKANPVSELELGCEYIAAEGKFHCKQGWFIFSDNVSMAGSVICFMVNFCYRIFWNYTVLFISVVEIALYLCLQYWICRDQ
jgi:hypothetical protein